MISPGRLARAASVAGDARHAQERSESLDVAVPNVIEFVVDPAYLGLQLYPRQATLLKLIFLQLSLLTDYDHRVIEEWTSGFELDDTAHAPRWIGREGIQPDVMERARYCKAEGRKWFGEVIAVIGRRGSKGYLGAIAGAYVLWNFLQLGDPQRALGIAPTKRLSAFVFAGRLEQARANQFRDLAEIIGRAACFEPFVAKRTTDSLTLYAPNQVAAGGVGPEQAAFEILAREATPLSGRGPAAFMMHYDEMAHSMASGANRSAAEIHDAASPALSEFGKEAFVFLASSPWEQIGRFHERYLLSLEVDQHMRQPRYPDMLMLQLPSWALYQDFELTRDRDLQLWPGGPPFQVLDRAVQADNEWMRRQFQINPRVADTEYGAQWVVAQDAYLDRHHVERIFAPWRGHQLVTQNSGASKHVYVAHGDPARVGSNFGWGIAHVEKMDSDLPHVFFDVLHAWRPQDWPNHEIHYLEVVDEIEDYIDAFQPKDVTFDQFQSAMLVDHVQRHCDQGSGWGRTRVDVRTATQTLNWEMAENFKIAIGLGLVHAPLHELAKTELLLLREQNQRVEGRTAGEVQTTDLADVMFNCVHMLLGDVRSIHEQLAETPLAATHPGPFERNPYADQLARTDRRPPLAYPPDLRHGYRQSWRRRQ